MNKLLLVVLSFGLLLSLSNSAIAQKGSSSNSPKIGKISGVIKDARTNESIGYASIGIYNSKDSTVVTGNFSKDDGSFSFEKLPLGRYYVVVTFVGYKKQIISDIVLSSDKKTAALGIIRISSSVVALKGVEVVANVAPVSYQIDKKVINITQNITAAGGTLADALQTAPSVQTDVEGNITLRGSSNFTVLVDGRPSPIAGSEALQQMPANLVENVEIITNPSAKYDADGSSGIINIVTKKQKVKGTSALLNVSAGTANKYSSNLNINYRVSKFNFTFGADYNNSETPFKSSGYNIDTLSLTSLKKQTINGNGSLNRIGKGVNFGIDYTINAKNSITLNTSMGNRSFARTLNSTYRDQYYDSSNANPSSIYYTDASSPEFERNYKTANLDYVLKLNDKGHQLSAAAWYTNGPGNNMNTLRVDTTDVNRIPIGTTGLLRQSNQNSNQTDFRTKLDYTLPFGSKGKLEAGYQGRYSYNTGEDQVLNYSANQWIEDLAQRDMITFTDNIQSEYATLSNSMTWFNYQLGLRGEYEDRILNQQIQNKEFEVKRFDLFPTVHLTRELPLKLQLQASYTRRINRPGQWNLNPFIVQLDPQSIRQGNPGLLPEFTNSYELNLEKKITDASFVSVEGFMRETSDLIQQISLFDPSTQITNNTFANIDHDRSMGAEFMAYLEPFKWLSLNTSLDVFNYHLYGTPVPSVANNINTWNLHFSPIVRLTKQTILQLNYVYNAPSITAQGTRSGFHNTTLAIKQNILKRKGSLTFQVRHLEGPTDMITTTSSPHQYRYDDHQREGTVFMLTFNYRINSYKVKEKGKMDDSDNEQESESQDF